MSKKDNDVISQAIRTARAHEKIAIVVSFTKTMNIQSQSHRTCDCLVVR